MRSPSSLNYEIRPCKFVERKILLASLNQIIISMGQEYQYIGFGGLTFTDFKLIHKELGINSMYSIEGCYSPEKLEFNKPFSCIKILHGQSNDKLKDIDLKKPSIVWLDYDGTLSMDFFTDINLLFNTLPHGSVYIMSCNSQLQDDEANKVYTDEEFKKIYNNLVPFDIEKNCCMGKNSYRTIKRMIDEYCEKVIDDRNKVEKGCGLKYKSLYNIKYKDAANMYTCGGVIINKDYKEDQLFVKNFEFLNDVEPFEIDIPNITHREALRLDQIINMEEEENKIINDKILKKKDIDKYKKFYKYMPNYYDVRL